MITIFSTNACDYEGHSFHQMTCPAEDWVMIMTSQQTQGCFQVHYSHGVVVIMLK